MSWELPSLDDAPSLESHGSDETSVTGNEDAFAGLDLGLSDAMFDAPSEGEQSKPSPENTGGMANLSDASDDDFSLSFDDEFEKLAAEFDAEHGDDSAGSGLLDEAPWESAEKAPKVSESFASLGVESRAEVVDTPTSPPTPEVPVSQAAESAGGDIDFSSLSLVDFEDDSGMEEAAASASAPQATESAAPSFESSDSFLNLSLEPLDDDASSDEVGQAQPQSGIKNMIAIGASIGGPDALRQLLTELPASLEAGVVVLQHLNNSVFDRLAEQLRKVCALPIHLAKDGQQVGHGEVLIVPGGMQLYVSQEGVVNVRPMDAETAYSPDISQTFMNLSNDFGKNLTAIVLSGMAGDAVEGATQVKRAGGDVWVQSAASCVVSTMVDGVIAQNVHAYEGTPKELGQRCAEQFSE